MTAEDEEVLRTRREATGISEEEEDVAVTVIAATLGTPAMAAEETGNARATARAPETDLLLAAESARDLLSVAVPLLAGTTGTGRTSPPEEIASETARGSRGEMVWTVSCTMRWVASVSISLVQLCPFLFFPNS